MTINVPVDYMARDVMVLMGENSRATGGVGPENRDFLGPEMETCEASAIPLVIFGPKSRYFQGPLLLMARVMDFPS
jgi:hypothetical protein